MLSGLANAFASSSASRVSAMLDIVGFAGGGMDCVSAGTPPDVCEGDKAVSSVESVLVPGAPCGRLW